MIRRTSPCLLLFSSLLACGPTGLDEPVPPDVVSTRTSAIVQNISGTVFVQKANGSTNFLGAGFNVKFCNNLFPGASSGSGSCLTGVTNSAGVYQISPNALSGAYWAFTWSDSVYWGSSSQSAFNATVPLFDGSFNTVNMLSRPRPLPPQAVSPANGATNLATNVSFTWTDGLDADRRTPSWPVTYDVYRNVTGSAEALVASGVGCCSTSATLAAGTSYQWRVVARMNTQVGAPGDPLYRTSSARFSFSTAPVLAPRIRVVDNTTNLNITNGGLIDLGSAPVGASIPRSFTIRNDGNATLTINNPSAILSGSGYTLTAPPSGSVAPGGGAPFSVRFDATSGGTFVATVTIQSNDATSTPFVFQIRAATTTQPRLRVSNAGLTVACGGSVDLGHAPRGGAPLSRALGVHNDGTATLSITGQSLSGSSLFGLTPGPSSLAPGGSGSLQVSFNPTVAGSHSTQLTLSSNDPASPCRITLLGTADGPRLALSANLCSAGNGGTCVFPSVAPGVGQPVVFTISNLGNQSLIIHNPTTLLATAGGFQLTVTPTTPIAPGGSTTFRVRLLAAAPGTYTGTVTLLSNDATASPYSFTVRGTVGGAPRVRIVSGDGITLSDGGTYAGFPLTTVGTPVSRAFTIYNDGDAELTLSNPTGFVSGAAFSLIMTPPTSIPAGGSGIFRVRLHTNTAGTHTGALTLQSNDPLGPFDQVLRGTVN